MHKNAFLLLPAIFLGISLAAGQPRFTKENKPWTYWWWMGSAVTEKGITQHLEAYQKAGLGGVHIVPLYGVKGQEQHFLSFLSPGWIKMVNHTVAEASRLGLGVDMTTGTGWPFGGPSVSLSDAGHTFTLEDFVVSGGSLVEKAVKKEGSRIVAISGYDQQNHYLDLTDSAHTDGMLRWTVPPGSWKVYVLYEGNTGQYVKRAAPGGEGFTLDPFNKNATERYLHHFDSSFIAGGFKGGIRAFYNDSYEVYGANWTTGFLEGFRKRRGYDLRAHLQVWKDSAITETGKRIWMDYHATIADLILEEFARPWTAWAHRRQSLTRYEAHGSPGNLLDLYASADIPETETFGPSLLNIPGVRIDPDYNEETFGRPDPLALKFASSAAHVTGKKLVGSESCTWLADHFKVALSQVKPQIDELFVTGITHLSFHGMPYSPAEEPFPGWLFYASTNFGHTAHFWNELPLLTAYIAHCQYYLQSTSADNDILLYFPIHDLWTGAAETNTVRMLDVHHTDWLTGTPMGALAALLYDKGYTFDYVSDGQLKNLQVTAGGTIKAPGAFYKTIVVPACRYMPVESLSTLEKLAAQGARIVFSDQMPASVPGLFNYRQRERELAGIKKRIAVSKNAIVARSVEDALRKWSVGNESLAGQGLSFVRKKHSQGKLYFIANLGNKFREGEIVLNTPAASVQCFDPLAGTRGLKAFTKTGGATRLFLKLLPGQTCFIRTFDRPQSGPNWREDPVGAQSYELDGPWNVSFLEGAPGKPAPFRTDSLRSWTLMGNEAARYFSGTARYEQSFDLPAKPKVAGKTLIDLGDVRESARVILNGKDIGFAWSVPFRLTIPEGVLQEKNNRIVIEVKNLSFNRVIDLDRRGVPWKKFHDINFVNIKYQPYDASRADPMPSGLLGPVKMVYE